MIFTMLSTFSLTASKAFTTTLAILRLKSGSNRAESISLAMTLETCSPSLAAGGVRLLVLNEALMTSVILEAERAR